jgi:hypothetical protein
MCCLMEFSGFHCPSFYLTDIMSETCRFYLGFRIGRVEDRVAILTSSQVEHRMQTRAHSLGVISTSPEGMHFQSIALRAFSPESTLMHDCIAPILSPWVSVRYWKYKLLQWSNSLKALYTLSMYFTAWSRFDQESWIASRFERVLNLICVFVC